METKHHKGNKHRLSGDEEPHFLYQTLTGMRQASPWSGGLAWVSEWRMGRDIYTGEGIAVGTEIDYMQRD